MSEQLDLRRELSAVNERLRNARAAIAEGREVSLEGLDNLALKLCEQMENLSVDEAQSLEPIVDELLLELDRSAAMFQQQLDQQGEDEADTAETPTGTQG